MEIEYILVEKERIFDDTKVRHLGGWPQSFVDGLVTLNFVERIFENSEASVWKVL
jgi:hypothetical protein